MKKNAANCNRKKIMIFGASGQLGCYLVEKLSENFDVIGITRSNVNIKNTKDLRKLRNDFNPEIVINCIAYLEQNNVNKKENMFVNFRFVKKIRAIFKDAFLVHISSERVYEPSNSFNSELDFLKQKAGTPYGIAKSKADKFLYFKGRDYLVIRPSWLHSKGKRNFITKIRSLNLESVSIVTDDISRVSSGSMIYEVIDKSIWDENIRGIWNIGSSDNLSRYELYQTYIKHKKIKQKVLETTSTEIGVDLKSIQYLFMDISKYENVFGKKTSTSIIKNWIKEEEWKQ